MLKIHQVFFQRPNNNMQENILVITMEITEQKHKRSRQQHFAVNYFISICL